MTFFLRHILLQACFELLEKIIREFWIKILARWGRLIKTAQCFPPVMFLILFAGLHGMMRLDDVTGLAQQCMMLWIIKKKKHSWFRTAFSLAFVIFGNVGKFLHLWKNVLTVDVIHIYISLTAGIRRDKVSADCSFKLTPRECVAFRCSRS